MGAVPFAQFYWTDFFADTLQLDGHESGAYLMLLGAAWVADECKLPDDDRKLARCARLTLEQWREVRDAVLQYWVLKDGFWTQKRLSIEHAKAVAKLEKLRANGAKGGRPKALTNGPNKPNGSGQKNQKPSKRAIESESEKKNSSPKNSLTLTDAEKVSAAADGSSLGSAGPPPADDWNLAALLLIADRDLGPAQAARIRHHVQTVPHPVPYVLKALHNAGIRPAAAPSPALTLVPDPGDPDAAEVWRRVEAAVKRDRSLDTPDDREALERIIRTKLERERREGSSHGDQAKQG